MIVALLIIALAFIWLLKETNYLRIRLPVNTIGVKVKSMTIPKTTLKPSIFEQLDMPPTTGNINIICVRE